MAKYCLASLFLELAQVQIICHALAHSLTTVGALCQAHTVLGRHNSGG
jgi:hypothetical protein